MESNSRLTNWRASLSPEPKMPSLAYVRPKLAWELDLARSSAQPIHKPTQSELWGK